MAALRRVVLFYPFHFIAESWNGLDEHLRLLAAHLDRDRYDLIVADHPGDGSQTARLAEVASIRRVSVGARDRRPLARVRELRALMRELGVTLLHMHSPTAGGQAVPALAARASGVAATLATYHQIQPQRLVFKRRIVNAVAHGLLVDRTIAVSTDVKRTLTRNAGLLDRHLVVIPNGIDPEPPPGARPHDLRRAPDDVLIGAFARLSPEKGLPGVLDAMRIVAAKDPRARLLVAGDGPQRDELIERAKRLELGDRVEFLGFRRDARLLMAQLDIFVHAPLYEGFGLVVLEAMAAGLPVVAARVAGGITDTVVDGKTGILVAPGDTETLATALLSLVNDPDARQRLGAAGRARCLASFSARAVAARTAAIYDELLARRGDRLNLF
jgi:glycosyltransferase involved in cell wall biosynthesis